MGECSVKSRSASHEMTREVVRIEGNQPHARPSGALRKPRHLT